MLETDKNESSSPSWPHSASPPPLACLQIIIVITGGELADGPTVEVPPSISQGVDSQQVRTFIYQLSDSTPGTPTPGVADLSSLACTLGGSYDEVPRDNILDDPLSTLRSFYSYVASLRFALDGQKPLWVPSYAAYTVIGNVISVAYPAFDGDVLIGVAAIDLLTDAVEAEWPNAIDNWRKPADNKQSQGSPVNCTVNLAPDAAVCPAGNSADRGLCAGEVAPRPDLEPTTVKGGSDWGKEVVGMRLSFPDNSRVGGTPSTATSTTSTTQLVSSPDLSTVGSPQVATTGSRLTNTSVQAKGRDSGSNTREPWTDAL
ncbi:hypothetical protein AXG93_789s1070 [Marchantia polymorpha subsp. ruderalis]|uniref:Uncharacterized protein n=1 Tax=Marchantia polymorpha subsp. ruderalis TaxID=1480154 RepID=A0A176VGQ7_MARPO|nr:hypothetical protein AXG93_789s1070 [Marchantia polymorpha subsp. ruderalis]